MKRFYIADMHLFHERVIKDAKRPYENVAQMHNDIIVKWNRKVGKNDIVYVVGDVASPTNECDISNVVDILKILNGNKVLIVGNHDRESIKDFKFRKCFIDIREYTRVVDGGVKVVLFHFPMESWEGDKKGVVHLHGHIHNDYIDYKKNRYNVGVDVIDFEPKTLKEIVSIHEKKDS